METTVTPKGKARKAAAKAHYRTSLMEYVTHFVPVCCYTLGLRIRAIVEWHDVKLNGLPVDNAWTEIKPGDLVSANDGTGTWHYYTVTAEQIERTW